MPRQRNAADCHAFGNHHRRRRFGHRHTRRSPPLRSGFARTGTPYLARGRRIPAGGNPQQGHCGQPRRIRHPDRRRPDPATSFHSGPHDFRAARLLRHRIARHHYRDAHQSGAAGRDHLADPADEGRPQQQQRRPDSADGLSLPDAGSLPLRQGVQHGLLAQRPDPRKRLRRRVPGLGRRRFGTGNPAA